MPETELRPVFIHLGKFSKFLENYIINFCLEKERTKRKFFRILLRIFFFFFFFFFFFLFVALPRVVCSERGQGLGKENKC